MTDDLQQARVEAAAEGMWNLYGDRGMFTHAPEHLRNGFMKDARAALAAADAVDGLRDNIAIALTAEGDRWIWFAQGRTEPGRLRAKNLRKKKRQGADQVLAVLRGEVAGDESI